MEQKMIEKGAIEKVDEIWHPCVDWIYYSIIAISSEAVLVTVDKFHIII